MTAATRGKKNDLIFQIEVSDRGEVRGLLNKSLEGADWKPIGKITFDRAAASYNGDFVIHFHHPKWRNEPNEPASETGPGKLGVFINWVAGKVATLLGFFGKKA